jgi:hypothetical protein
VEVHHPHEYLSDEFVKSVSDAQYYTKTIPKALAEIKKLSYKNCAINGWKSELSNAAKLYSRGQVRPASQLVDNVCDGIDRFVRKGKISSSEVISSLLCCETEAPKHSCSRRR